MIIVRNKKYYNYSDDDDDIDDLDNDDNSWCWKWGFVQYTIDVCGFLHLYMSPIRGDIFEKILKMITQQQSNFAFWPPDKKITNWKKKSKCHDRTPCVLMYDLWCPEFTVRNDAVSYRISLMSNQKAYANRQQTPTVSMNALDHNFVIEKVTNIITARHIISTRELFLFSLSLFLFLLTLIVNKGEILFFQYFYGSFTFYNQ